MDKLSVGFTNRLRFSTKYKMSVKHLKIMHKNWARSQSPMFLVNLTSLTQPASAAAEQRRAEHRAFLSFLLVLLFFSSFERASEMFPFTLWLVTVSIYLSDC